METGQSRENWVAQTMVELADTLVDDFDVIDFLTLLADRCVQLLDAAEVGLLLADFDGNLRVAGSSSERLRHLELFELQNDEGPCLDCYRTGEQVLNEDLEGSIRWPTFAPRSREAGFRMAHALPMRLRGRCIGAVNVLTAHERYLAESEAALGQAMADIATIGLLQEQAVQRATVLAEQLEGALSNRVTIEQAKGVVAARLEVDVAEAFALFRAYARAHGRRLSDVAANLLARRLSAEDVRGL